MSGTVRPRRLRFGTHADSGQMYRVYRNQAAAAYSSLYFFIFLSLQFSNIKIFRHTFLRKCEVSWTVGRCIVCTRIRLLLHIHPLISSFFFLSNFQTLKFFVTLFSGTVRPRNLVQTWSMGRYIVCTGIRLLLLICPFISSFFFLSSFQTLKFFVSFFSETVRPRRLKLGTHMDSGQMYHAYWNQAVAAHLSLYYFIFLSLQFSNIKIFCHTFLRN